MLANSLFQLFCFNGVPAPICANEFALVSAWRRAQAIDNYVSNAVRHSAEGGVVTIVAEIVRRGPLVRDTRAPVAGACPTSPVFSSRITAVVEADGGSAGTSQESGTAAHQNVSSAPPGFTDVVEVHTRARSGRSIHIGCANYR